MHGQQKMWPQRVMRAAKGGYRQMGHDGTSWLLMRFRRTRTQSGHLLNHLKKRFLKGTAFVSRRLCAERGLPGGLLA